MSQQITKAKAALDAVRNIPIDQLISAGVQLAPMFRSLFDAIAEGFKRIGLRAKVDALIEVNEAQQEQLDKLTVEYQALAARVIELEGRAGQA